MSNNIQIQCPKCDHEFNVEEAIAKRVDAGYQEKIKQIETGYKKEFKNKLNQLEKRERQLQKLEESTEAEIQKRLKEQENQLNKKLKAHFQADFEQQLEKLTNENREKAAELNTMRKRQLELKEKEEALIEQREGLELKLKEQLFEERQKIKKQLDEKLEERVSVKVQEKQILINQLKERIDEMKQKTDQGSMQVQGEAQELVIEELLRSKFPFDNVEEVGKGVRGADCIQSVQNRFGTSCGTIIYESKRTKKFSNTWLNKLKQDALNTNAKIPVIVSERLPEGIRSIGQKEGVWICNFENLPVLAAILRFAIIREFEAMDVQVNKGDKMHMLYDYLTGNEFKMQVNNILEGFKEMKVNLEKQKRSMQASWKRQEKELERVIESTIHMHSSVKGIAGSAVAALPTIEEEKLN